MMINAIAHYIGWHYARGIKEGFGLFKNIEWFIYSFFSIEVLLSTFFDRFERLGDERKKGEALSDIAGSIIVNTLMRLVGMFIRFFTIAIGLLCMVIFALFFAILAIGWLAFPIFVPVSLIIGLSMII